MKSLKGFIAIGGAIILGLILTGIWAHYCTACCDGKPCNAELNQKLNAEQSNTQDALPVTEEDDPKVFSVKRFCAQPRYQHLEMCKDADNDPATQR
jgi:hypothetical protein